MRWSTALAVIGVATVAAVASYEHAYDLVRAHAWCGRTARRAGLPAWTRSRWTASSARVRWSCLTPRAARRRFPAGAVAARPGHRGDARGQRRARLGSWPGRRGGGRMAGGRAGRLLRTAHDDHPKLAGGTRQRDRQRGHPGPASAKGSWGMRRPSGRRPGSLSPRDPRPAACGPAPGAATARLPGCMAG